MATAKHKFPKLTFNPANQKSVDFLDELQKLAKDAFGKAAHVIIHRTIHIFQNATTPEEIKKSGPLGERHVRTIFHTPGKGVRAEWFGSP